MTAVSDYLESLDGPYKAELERIAHIVHRIVPDAEASVSYGMPAFRYDGKPLVGFMAAKNHLSLFPFSSMVIERLADKLVDFDTSKGTIHFTPERQLPEKLVIEILRLRQNEIAAE